MPTQDESNLYVDRACWRVPIRPNAWKAAVARPAGDCMPRMKYVQAAWIVDDCVKAMYLGWARQSNQLSMCKRTQMSVMRSQRGTLDPRCSSLVRNFGLDL